LAPTELIDRVRNVRLVRPKSVIPLFASRIRRNEDGELLLWYVLGMSIPVL
jgi:hypothetical protein